MSRLKRLKKIANISKLAMLNLLMKMTKEGDTTTSMVKKFQAPTKRFEQVTLNNL